MSQDSLHRLDIWAAAVTDFSLQSTQQCQRSPQYIHGPTVVINPVSKFNIRQHFRVFVDLVYSKDQCLSKFEFSQIQAGDVQ